MPESLDTQQIELLATTYLESRLIKEGFEVARPSRDRGIDLIAYRDVIDEPFHAVPIQLKAATNRSFSIESKYRGRGIIMAYLWHVLEPSPRVFFVPYEDAVMLLSEKTRQTDSWLNKGTWAITNPGKSLEEALQRYENRFDLLQGKDFLVKPSI